MLKTRFLYVFKKNEIYAMNMFNLIPEWGIKYKDYPTDKLFKVVIEIPPTKVRHIFSSTDFKQIQSYISPLSKPSTILCVSDEVPTVSEFFIKKPTMNASLRIEVDKPVEEDLYMYVRIEEV